MTNNTALSSGGSESTDFKFVPSSASGLESDSSESRSHTSGESSSTQYRVRGNTVVQGMDCKWQIYIVFKRIVGGGTAERGWQLSITSILHLQNEQLLETLELRGASTKPLSDWYTTATCSTKDTTVVGGEKKGNIRREH